MLFTDLKLNHKQDLLAKKWMDERNIDMSRLEQVNSWTPILEVIPHNPIIRSLEKKIQNLDNLSWEELNKGIEDIIIFLLGEDGSDYIQIYMLS